LISAGGWGRVLKRVEKGRWAVGGSCINLCAALYTCVTNTLKQAIFEKFNNKTQNMIIRLKRGKQTHHRLFIKERGDRESLLSDTQTQKNELSKEQLNFPRHPPGQVGHHPLARNSFAFMLLGFSCFLLFRMPLACYSLFVIVLVVAPLLLIAVHSEKSP